jgi:hypothetical protein
MVRPPVLSEEHIRTLASACRTALTAGARDLYLVSNGRIPLHRGRFPPSSTRPLFSKVQIMSRSLRWSLLRRWEDVGVPVLAVEILFARVLDT